jgi:hypothetical protein
MKQAWSGQELIAENCTTGSPQLKHAARSQNNPSPPGFIRREIEQLIDSTGNKERPAL